MGRQFLCVCVCECMFVRVLLYLERSLKLAPTEHESISNLIDRTTIKKYPNKHTRNFNIRPVGFLWYPRFGICTVHWLKAIAVYSSWHTFSLIITTVAFYVKEKDDECENAWTPAKRNLVAHIHLDIFTEQGGRFSRNLLRQKSFKNYVNRGSRWLKYRHENFIWIVSSVHECRIHAGITRWFLVRFFVCQGKTNCRR